jgi:hypothetical protein
MENFEFKEEWESIFDAILWVVDELLRVIHWRCMVS